MGDGNDNARKRRGRSLTRNESPMTRQRKKMNEMAENRSRDHTLLLSNDERPNISVLNQQFGGLTAREEQKRPDTPFVTPPRSFFSPAEFNDNPKHLYGLDKDKDHETLDDPAWKFRVPHAATKLIKKEPGVANDDDDSRWRWLWSALRSTFEYVTSKGCVPLLSIIIITSVIITGIFLVILNSGDNESDQKKKKKNDLEHVYLAKIESLLSQNRKQHEEMETMKNNFKAHDELIKSLHDEHEKKADVVENRLMSLENSTSTLREEVAILKSSLTERDGIINGSVDDVMRKVETLHESTRSNNTILNEHITKLLNAITTLTTQVTRLNDSTKMNDGKLNSQLKNLQVVNETLNFKVSSVGVDVRTMKNRTVEAVKKEIRKELQRERERYYGENSLCVGKECKFRSSNTAAHVQSALEVHRADTLGFPDFALKSGGGSIHGNHHSETCDFGNPSVKLFGLTLFVDPSSPRLVISSNHDAGDCWHMRGSEGYIVIKLATAIQPSMVSLEHLDKKLDQYSTYRYNMAPKDCEVYAWLSPNGDKKLHLGTFTYQREGSAVQTYTLRKQSAQRVLYMELRVRNNWGNPDCTCLYRFRVHGMSFDWTSDED